MKKVISTIIVLCLCIVTVCSSIPFATAASKPAKPKSFKVSSYNHMYNTVTLKLKEKTKLNYELKIYNHKNKLKRIVELKKAKLFWERKYKKRFPYKVENIKKNQFYKIVARSYKIKNKKRIYSAKSKPVYACQSIRCDLNWDNKIITWANIKGATRYKIVISTQNQPNKYFLLATSKKAKYALSDSDLKKLGKSFNAKIIAQKKVGKKYYSSDSVFTYLWYM